MDWFDPEITNATLIAALAIAGVAGFVKGAIGFAMPMIMMAGFSALLPPHLALAGLILPTLLTNISQALRQGLPAALSSARDYRRFLIATLTMLIVSAQFAHLIPQQLFYLLLGVPISLFAALQLSGRSLALALEQRSRAEWTLGIIGGLYGGVSGIWGPPLLVYLLSVGAQKAETVRVQGVVFLLGAIVLLAAHVQTGLMNGPNLLFSASLCLPALLGQWLGLRLQDRLHQASFRKWTQILLVVTGLNLVLRALLA